MSFLLLVSLCAEAAPVFDHIVIVIEENQDAATVLASPSIASLAARGLSFTRMYGIAHPSQPNYVALFSGSVRGVKDDRRYDLSAPSMATALCAAHLSFASYAEGLPSAGWRGMQSGAYVRKHNPAASFTNVPASALLPFSSFPSDYSQLPTVSFVIPNLQNDMHDGTVAAADDWLARRMDGYVRWAMTHNSLFILTFDECSGSHPVASTPIATILVGQGVAPGISSAPVNLYSLHRFVMETCGLAPLGEAASAPEITDAGPGISDPGRSS